MLLFLFFYDLGRDINSLDQLNPVKVMDIVVSVFQEKYNRQCHYDKVCVVNTSGIAAKRRALTFRRNMFAA